MSLITVNNLYENGVCDEFTIYTGTTYNGDPYIIPVSAQSIGSHTLPHTFNVGTYEGPLYIFLVHCDFYVTPPPSELPKRQGGFQVKLINIECEECPPFSPPTTPNIDCDVVVTFNEYLTPTPSPSPSPTPTPSPSTTASPTPTPTEEITCQCFEINSNRQGYFNYSYVDCDGITVNATSDTPPMEEITFYICAQSIISVAEKVTYSNYGTCTEGVCDNTPTPSPSPSPTPTPSPSTTASPTPTPSPSENHACVCIEFSSISSSGVRTGYYDDCSGNPQTISVDPLETVYVCSNGFNVTVSDDKLVASLTDSNCIDRNCPSTTPTPSPTTETTEISAILLSNTTSAPNNANCDEGNDGLLENRVFVLYNTTWFTTNASGKNVVKSTFSLTDNEIINGGDSSYTIHPDSIWTGGPSVFRNSPDGTYMIADSSTEGTEKLLFQKNGNYGTTNKCGGLDPD